MIDNEHERTTDGNRTRTVRRTRGGARPSRLCLLAVAIAALGGCTDRGVHDPASADRDASDATAPDAAVLPGGGVAGGADGAVDATGRSAVGLYDASVDFDGIGRDVMRLQLTADGRLIEYDYQDDAIDRGAPCHRTRVLSLEGTGETRTLGDGVHSTAITLRPGEGVLELAFVDIADLDGDGDSAETLSTSLARLDDVDASSLALCS